MKYEYLEDPKPCPNCKQIPSEYTGLCPPIYICGVACRYEYGNYLQCKCGNKSITSSNLQYINKDWNERVIPMIKSGDCTFSWPYNYMTSNAREIYNKITSNIEIPSTEYLYDEDGNEVFLDFDETIRDIANYLDNEGFKIGDN